MATKTLSPGLSEAEITEILAMEKFMANELDWHDAPTNSNYIAATDSLLDHSGASVPGVFFELMVRRGRYSEDCNYTFGVYKIKAGKRHVVYRIDAMPPEKRSHKGTDGWWHGPHQHFGMRAEKFDPQPKLGCDHEAWFKEFLKRANITSSGKYLPPSSKQLF